MTRILVTGANGQLGRELRAQMGAHTALDAHFADRATLNLAKPETVAPYLQQHRYDLVINTAAYTAVDRAEAEEELADRINHLAVAEMAKTLAQQGGQLLQISTDYVFSGNHCRPYRETDPAAPTGVYGISKLRAEQAIIDSGVRGAIVRTGWLYSAGGHNFVNTMLRLGREHEAVRVVADQTGTPTHARDLAAALLKIVEHPALDDCQGELFHYSNEGTTSWYDFAVAIFELANIRCRVNPIASEDYPTPAPRPHFSVLDKSKIRQSFGLEIQHWRRALADFFTSRRNTV